MAVFELTASAKQLPYNPFESALYFKADFRGGRLAFLGGIKESFETDTRRFKTMLIIPLNCAI